MCRGMLLMQEQVESLSFIFLDLLLSNGIRPYHIHQKLSASHNRCDQRASDLQKKWGPKFPLKENKAASLLT